MIVREGLEVDHAIASVDVVAIVYLIRTLKRFKERNGHAIEGTVIVIAIETGIVRGDVPGVTIAIVTGIAKGISAIAIANVETGKIGAIVKRKIRKRFELRKNLWMVYFSLLFPLIYIGCFKSTNFSNHKFFQITLIIVILSQRLDHTLPL